MVGIRTVERRKLMSLETQERLVYGNEASNRAELPKNSIERIPHEGPHVSYPRSSVR